MTFEERVIKTVAGALEGKHAVTMASNLRNDLGVDSFGTVMILNALEDEFSITIQDTNFENVSNVADIVALLRKHLPDLESAAGAP